MRGAEEALALAQYLLEMEQIFRLFAAVVVCTRPSFCARQTILRSKKLLESSFNFFSLPSTVCKHKIPNGFFTTGLNIIPRASLLCLPCLRHTVRLIGWCKIVNFLYLSCIFNKKEASPTMSKWLVLGLWEISFIHSGCKSSNDVPWGKLATTKVKDEACCQVDGH